MTSLTPLAPDVREALAGAYVLGTLTAEEHAVVEGRCRDDAELAAAIREWEARLSPLAELVAPVEPGPDLWRRIAADTVASGGAIGVPANIGDLAAARQARETRLAASRNRWRMASAGLGMALAASLAAIGLFAPAYLESRRESGRYVGIVNTGGAMPALVVSVDTRRGELRIRPLGIRPDVGRSHELWAVRGNSPPVSLGLVDAAGARALRGLPLSALADPALVLAVSVEPAGGSPTGAPTGPVLFTGKLIKEE